jgi:predicted  nucleic acid-binding Zn-ribbon protein
MATSRDGDAGRRLASRRNTREDVLRVFTEAEERLSDPNVRIVKKLDKNRAEIDDLRRRLGKSETELAKCRSSRDRLQSELESVSREAESLREEVVWRREAENIRPIRKP